MSEPVKNPFDALLDAFRQVVREEIKAASKPAKALYTTKETADILNVDESWLSARARKGKIPHRMLGHYRYFSPADIQEIIDSSYVQGVQSKHDGQRASTDSEAASVEPGKAGNGAGDNRD
jgi:hypothetical protein